MVAATGWQMVDEGWGRRAADFATLTEPSSVREYLAVHRRLDLAAGERLLDMACGAGLALELAAIQGAVCSGIDASTRLVDVARLRNPGADLRVGDMAEPHFEAGSFDVVTSFRGIWGTTPAAMAQVARVLRPGGRAALTFWGDMATSPGGMLFSPFRLASELNLAHQSDMVGLKQPGAAAQFLTDAGLLPGEVFGVPCFLEFADAEHYARALASTGPGFEAVQVAGEQAFHDACLRAAEPFDRTGLPIRAELTLFGIIGHAPD